MTYIEPALPVLLLLGFVDLIRAWRNPAKTSRPWLGTLVFAGLLVLSMNVGAWAVSRPLEIWYDRDLTPRESADAIVVLAGAVSPASTGRPYALPAEDTYRRVRRAAWLFRHWKPLPILASGENPSADTMRHLLESEGVPPPMIWVEPRSTNTHENAVYSAEILRAHGAVRVVLVVEASSMPRASRSFRKAGIGVVPSPVRFTQLSWELSDWLPGWPAIKSNGETLHELGGLLWYGLRGWI